MVVWWFGGLVVLLSQTKSCTSLLSKEESERLLRGRIDETFLVRSTDLSGPSHRTVDIV